MLARLQKVSTFLLLGAAAAWLMGCALAQAPWWAYLGALVVVFGHVFVLGLEFIILGFVHREGPVPRATAGARVRAWLAESRWSMLTFNWRQPFRSHLYPDTLERSDNEPGAAVVLVHGFVCNRGVWLPLLARLTKARVPFIAVNLEPVFAESIDEYIPIVDAAVRRATAACGQPPVLVAHSMGGLVVRAWLAYDRHKAADRQRVARVITIGTPHGGTWLARLSRAPTARQMRFGSEWLVGLLGIEQRVAEVLAHDPASEPSAAVPFTCFYSECDNIVMPASTAMLPHADNRRLAGAAHIEMAFRDDVFDGIVRASKDKSSSTIRIRDVE